MINPQAPDFEITPVHPQRRHFGYALADKNTPPVVTILTPFYNTGEVFHQTAQSILQQSLQQFEWLIINDGSDDPLSLRILENYRQSDPRIRVIDHPQNCGLSAARNTGFAAARCEYVALLDSDDLLEPTAVEKWWWFLQTHPHFGFAASYHVAFEGKEYLWTGGFHDGAQNAERNRVSMMCMIRKSVHQKVGGFNESIRGGLEDWEFWMRCAAQGIWGATVPEFLAWYRLREDHGDRWQNLQEERIVEFRNQFKQKYPHLYSGQFPNPPLRNFELDLTLPSLEIPINNRLTKPKRRVLLILPWLVMGGAERFALNLMDQLEQHDWQITVLATAPANHVWQFDFEKRSEDVFILPNFIPVSDYLRFIGYLIYSRQFDALMIQGSHEGYRLLPVLRGLYPQIPVVDYLHFVTPEWMQGGFPRLSLLYKEYLDLTITSSEQLRQWMIENGDLPDRLKVCYIGVDPCLWKPDKAARHQIRTQLGIDQDETVILFAARVEQQKQPLFTLKVVERLVNDGKPFRLLIAGDGSLRSEVEQRIKDAHLNERVILLGSVPTEQMPSIMAAADIFFLPSQNEGIAQAIYEAMACGLVVVGAKVGGQAELFADECGFLIEAGDEQMQLEEYQRTLGKLIDNSSLRQLLGERARQRIQDQFTLDEMGNCMAGVMERVLNKEKDLTKEPTSITKELLEQTRLIVEFLQARQEGLRLYQVVQEVSDQFSDLYQRYEGINRVLNDLMSPKPPSYWFYLWVRQLFLPIYSKMTEILGVRTPFVKIKNNIKRLLIKKFEE